VLSRLAKQAMDGVVARFPSGVQDAVARVQQRYEERRVDAKRALDEFGAFEERVAKVAVGIVAFPFVATGAIRELYTRVTELERDLKDRDATIKKLEDRLKRLESDGR
jgi:hypothetical protein